MEEMFKLKFKCLTLTPYTQKKVTKININLSFETPASPCGNQMQKLTIGDLY